MFYSPKSSITTLKAIAQTLPSDSIGRKALADGVEALEYYEKHQSITAKPSGPVMSILNNLGLGKG